MKLACALALLAAAAMAAAERNAVGNAGFENGLEQWDTAGDAEGVAIDAAVAHSGRQSLRVTGSTSGVHQLMQFGEPFQHPLRVSGWSKSQGLAGDVYGIWIEGTYADGTKLEQQVVQFDRGTHEWQYRELIVEPFKPVQSLEVVAILIKAHGKAWFDDLEVTLAPFGFRGITISPDVGMVAGLSAQAAWTAELRGPAGVVASGSGDGPPVQLHWTAPRGDYALKLSATDEFRKEKIDDVRKVSVSRTADVSIWVESSMKRVLPQALPGDSAAARIALAGNEYESFQICLLSPIPVKGVRVETSDLTAAGGARIPASAVEWRQVGYVHIDRLRHSEANERAWPGWWPDPLLPVAEFDLQAGFTQPVWITVHAAAGTRAGEYAGEVRVLAEGRPAWSVPLRVKVYGFSLPVKGHLKTAFALLGDELEGIHGKPVSTPIRRRYGDFLLEHRLNADDIYRTRTPDLADLLHYRPRGLSSFNLLYLIPEDGALIPELQAYTPELGKRLLERLSPAIPKLRDAGLIQQAYVYGFDESDPEFFPAMRSYFGEIKRRFPELRTMTTAHIPLDPKQLKNLNVDWIVPLTSNYDYEKAEQCRRAGFQVWSYLACDPREPYANFLADDPLIEARVLFWQAYQQKFDGFLYWGTNIWERRGNRRPIDLARGPLLDWNVTTGKGKDDRWLQELHGDGLLLYPGADGPIGSIRLANLRDGLEDYEYLWMAGLRSAALPVTRDLTHFTLDPAVVYRQREAIARRISAKK